MITLDLIATNVYNSIEAPKRRGLSFIEIWMVGVQIPILIAIFEYGIILAMIKRDKGKKNSIIKVGKGLSNGINKNEIDDIGRNIDEWAFTGSLIFIIVFNFIYWSVGLNVQ